MRWWISRRASGTGPSSLSLIHIYPPPSADLSLSLSLVQPLVTGNGTVDVLATVTNNGPADAEAVQVQVGVDDPDNNGRPPLECFPGGVAICNTGGGALIPSLPAGASMNVEFVYNYLLSLIHI